MIQGLLFEKNGGFLVTVVRKIHQRQPENTKQGFQAAAISTHNIHSTHQQKSSLKTNNPFSGCLCCNTLNRTFEHIAVFLIEAIHATSGVHDFLFASVERMAV